MYRNSVFVVLLCLASRVSPGVGQEVENPPETPLDVLDNIDGSGDGILQTDEIITTTTAITPVLEDVLPNSEVIADSSVCEKCTCSQEGEGEAFVMTVDCSNLSLNEVPVGIDERTTKLNIQNNNLEKLPKSIGLLKNLQILNAYNNSIKELEFGSVSDLSQLRILQLANNRLLEYPQDLKNGFAMTHLEELNLNGNDIREAPGVEVFSLFSALKRVTMMEISDTFMRQLCHLNNSTMEEVCAGVTTCFDCLNERIDNEKEYIPVGPAMIPVPSNIGDPMLETSTAEDDVTYTSTISTSELAMEPFNNNKNESAVVKSGGNSRSFKQSADLKENDEVKVATSTAESGGGVSSLVVGLVVAGMVLVVAGVVIKKNWNSVRDRCSSSPRPATDRPSSHPNGSAPEEVPLQEKSPA